MVFVRGPHTGNGLGVGLHCTSIEPTEDTTWPVRGGLFSKH